MVEGPKPTEQINQEILEEFLTETSVWDFYEITKGEYMNESEDEKKSLIIQYLNFCYLFLYSLKFLDNLFLCCLEFVDYF